MHNFEKQAGKNSLEGEQFTFVNLFERFKGIDDKLMLNKIVFVNGNPLDRISFGDELNFISAEPSEMFPVEGSKDYNANNLNKNGFPKRKLINLKDFIEILKYNSRRKEVAESIVHIDGKLIDHISIGTNVELVAKK
ncbi:MAG: hypothetical protein WCI93_01150 [bacterium]